MDELKAVGVAVDLSRALKLIVTQFKSFLSSSSLTPFKVISLLECIREMNEKLPSHLQELHQCLLGEKWLRTCNGYRTPSESILFSSKWGTISLFVDLPLIDDSFYGIVIYGFEDELKMLGAITEFEGGAPFVARGLTRPIEPRFVTDLGTIALLECIKYLISKSKEQTLLDNLFSNLMRSKSLKTRKVYKKPEECILFDPTWKVILEETDAPVIEHTFYKTEIFMYKNQLRAIGVKVDPGDVCSLLSRYLMSLTETSSITRTYNFLHMFNWKPELPDKSDYQVWVINHNDNCECLARLAIPDKIPKCPLTRLSYSYSDYLTLKTKTLLRGQEEAEIELGADSKCEKSMFLLLTSEYLELFAEDEKFLDAAFLLPKQCPVIRYLPILPPIDDKSQLLTQPNLKESRRKVPNYPDPPKSSSQQLELLSPPMPESSQKKPRQ
uniref:Uncharacterized protein n=1 Tax=Vitis vinifera TaxID=29760 RepID=F6H164_VITVI